MDPEDDEQIRIGDPVVVAPLETSEVPTTRPRPAGSAIRALTAPSISSISGMGYRSQTTIAPFEAARRARRNARYRSRAVRTSQTSRATFRGPIGPPFDPASEVRNAAAEEVEDRRTDAARCIAPFTTAESGDRRGLPRWIVVARNPFPSTLERSSTAVDFPAPSPPTIAINRPAEPSCMGRAGRRNNRRRTKVRPRRHSFR